MKETKSITKVKIEEILEAWNKNCEASGINENFKLVYERADEPVTVQDKKGKEVKGVVKVGRITLSLIKVIYKEYELTNEDLQLVKVGKILDVIEYTKSKRIVDDVVTTILYKKNHPINAKEAFKSEAYWHEILSKELLYEMIGNFCLVLRGMAMKRIEIQQQNDFLNQVNEKINKEEQDIVNKPEAEKTEEDKIFTMIDKARKVKVKKTGILDKSGADFLSETIE